jgi:hypothetical protein
MELIDSRDYRHLPIGGDVGRPGAPSAPRPMRSGPHQIRSRPGSLWRDRMHATPPDGGAVRTYTLGEQR